MNCPACGAEIVSVNLPDGEQKTLDAHAQAYSGPDRYMIEGEDASKARPVSPTVDGYAYGDHDVTCPAKVREREKRERL
jgi:hypothetical protein